MAAHKGIAFRATANYQGPYAPEDTYSLGEIYPVTRNGVTFGWSASLTGQATDRFTANDARLQRRATSPSTFQAGPELTRFAWQ